MDRVETEVLVVGAGPVGLTAAIELTRRGFEVVIIDQGSGPATESRAIGVNPRTLEILEPSGVTETLLDVGTRIRRAVFFSRGRHLGTIRFDRVDHRWPFMLAIPQSDTERILIDALRNLGVEVRWGTRFASFQRLEEGVFASVASNAGSGHVRCRWMIGCDGVRSDVRRAARIEFEGEPYEHEWGIADARLDWERPADEISFFFSRDGAFGVIPMGNELYRLVRTAPHPEQMLPSDAVAEVVRSSEFLIEHRLAAAFQTGPDGPLFLAGDAAHVHSPAGARGMNGGIEDAATLAWLLEGGKQARYEELRRPVAKRVISQVDLQSRQIASKNRLMLRLREIFVPALLRVPRVERYAATFLMAVDSPLPEWLTPS